MKAAFQRTLDAEIPIDTQVADIDYMDRKLDFTLNPEGDWTGFPAYVDHLHNTDHKLVFILDPGIEADYATFKRAMDTDATFIEWPREDLIPPVQDKYPLTKGKKIMLGKVWPDNLVGFPDFLDPTNKTDDWWTREFKLLHQKAQFDGIWIDMNEPSNFDTNSDTDPTMLQCPKSGPDAHLDMPPYQTRNVYQWPQGTVLSTKTLCMLARTARDTQNFYDTKCLYGWSESKSTMKALSATTGQRGAVITRSTFPSSGRYTGTWLGDNTARWPDLQTSIIGITEFNMFGIPFVGADICGFNGNTTEELCLRWHQLGAFYPFMRNHNSINQIPQDPGVWPSVAEAAKKANHFRYRHLPYLFSLHFAASLYGGTVVRPPFFEFVQDEVTHTISHQFMLGPAIMVIPVIHEGATSVRGYLPETPDGCSGFHNFVAPTNYLIPVFVRGRQIVPRQVSAETTTATRKNPFQLLVTSAPNELGGWDANGRLFWDDGVTLVNDFKSHKYYDISFAYQASKSGSSITVVVNKRSNEVDMPALETIEILGYEGTPNFDTFTVNGKRLSVDLQESSYSPFTQVLVIHATNLIPPNELSNHIILTIKWKNHCRCLFGRGEDDDELERRKRGRTGDGKQLRTAIKGPMCNRFCDGTDDDEYYGAEGEIERKSPPEWKLTMSTIYFVLVRLIITSTYVVCNHYICSIESFFSSQEQQA
uniref:Alpha-glucosidase n=1 Tax=Steinernema glaseri TaxID=37863 RepID=A0A1I7ZM87_9BILA